MQFHHVSGPSRSMRKTWSPRHASPAVARYDKMGFVSADRVVADAVKISSRGSVEVACLNDVLTGGEVNVLVGGRHLATSAPPPTRRSVVEGDDLVTLGPTKSCRRHWETTLSDALVEAIEVHAIETHRERWRKHPDAPLLTTRARFFRDYDLSEEDLVDKREPNHESRLCALLSASDDAKRAYYGHPEDAAWIAFFSAIGKPLDDVTWVKATNFLECSASLDQESNSPHRDASASRTSDAPPFLVDPRSHYSTTVSATVSKTCNSAHRRVGDCTGDPGSAPVVREEAVSPHRSAAREELLQSFRSAHRMEVQHPPPGSPKWLEEFYEDPVSSPLRNDNSSSNADHRGVVSTPSVPRTTADKTVSTAAALVTPPPAVLSSTSSSEVPPTTHQPTPPCRTSRMGCFDLSKVDPRVGLGGVDFAAIAQPASALVSLPATERYLGVAPPVGKRVASGREYRQELLKAYHIRKAQGIANNAVYHAALDGLALHSSKQPPASL